MSLPAPQMGRHVDVVSVSQSVHNKHCVYVETAMEGLMEELDIAPSFEGLEVKRSQTNTILVYILLRKLLA